MRRRRKPVTLSERQLAMLRKDLVLLDRALGRLQVGIDDHEERLSNVLDATTQEMDLHSALEDVQTAVDEIDNEVARVHDLLSSVRRAARKIGGLPRTSFRDRLSSPTLS